MEKKQQRKEPISKDTIYKIMTSIAFAVAAIFFIKDLAIKEFGGAVFIGMCLVVFALAIFLMKKFQVKEKYQQITVSLAIMLLIFFISINSGDYYSDDYLLYLAAYGLAGLYLQPSYTRIQIVLGDILFILQFLIHPEKVESTGQFIMCMVIFNVAGVMQYLVIQRGHAFIERSYTRAKEAEGLVSEMNNIGETLQQNFESSSEKMNSLIVANQQLSSSAGDLEQGSKNITIEARNVSESCSQVHDKLALTEDQIQSLDDEMKKFEIILAENRKNMQEMSKQVEDVKMTVGEANNVFVSLQGKMDEIHGVLEHLNSISESTTMLALNAAIEASRAGKMGAGFAVVADEVQQLAVNSKECAGEVASVIIDMQKQIEKTSVQLLDSTKSIDASLETVNELEVGFGQLGSQFSSLYSNIEEQNDNIGQVNDIFAQLKEKISDMSSCSEDNQVSVQAIADIIHTYKEDIAIVVDDTKQIQELSDSMMAISRQQDEAEL